jgi:outer membrane lipoprotein SlyB
MRRHIAAAAFAGLVGLMPVAPAAAQQDNTIGVAIIGGGIGAIIGGAATGEAGGAIAGGIIGAAAGAMLGSQLEPRAHGYYWYHDGCWRRWRDGSYHRVHRRYCY